MRLYLKDLFSNTERHALEKQVMQDPFEAEAFEGLSEISAEVFTTDIEKLQSQLSERTKKTKVLFWQQPYAIAASVLLLIGFGVTMFMLNKADAPYQVVTNIQEVEDAVVVNESNIEKESDREVLFQEPDDSLKEETIVAYEAIEEEVPVANKAEPVIEKPMFSKKMPSAPAKAVVADAEVFEGAQAQEVEMLKEIETLSDVVASKRETVVAAEESLDLVTWSGMITNSYGEPLSGVSVILKGSEESVVTDFDGNYSIQAFADAKLEAVYLGFETKEILFENHKTITLDDDLAALEEVVVVGYGRGKRKVSGDVRKVPPKGLPSISAVKVEESLSGRVAGVSVTQSDEVANVQENSVAIAPQGSDAGFKQWLMKQLDPSEFEKGKEYSIEINFVVTEKGALTDFKTNAALKNSEKRHLKNTVLSSLNWTPAQNKNGTLKESKSLVLWFHF